MNEHRWRIVTSVIAAFGSGVLIYAPSATRADTNSPATMSPDAMKFRVEEIETLEKAAGDAERRLMNGTGTVADTLRDVLSDRQALMEVRLKVAASIEDRIVVLNDAAAVAKHFEDTIERANTAGLMPRQFAFEAKAARLELDAKLADEKVVAP